MKTEIAAILLLMLLAVPAFAAADNYFPNNVGIGTVLPVNKLEVIGKAYFGTGTPNTNHDFQIYGTTSDSTRAALHVANLAGTTALYARNDGNVGIGTTGPGSPLHVYSTADGIAIFEGNDHSIFYIKGTDNSEKSLNFDESGTLRWKIGMDNAPAGTTDDFIIKQTNNGNAEFTINTAGNVGIGTTGPVNMLDVVGDGDATTGFNLISASGNMAATGTQYGIYSSPTSTATRTAFGGIYSKISTAASANTLSLGYGILIDTPTKGSGSTITNNYGLLINDQSGIGSNSNFAIYSGGGTNYFAGNIGIGTTSPATFKLQIAGSIGPNANAIYDLGSAALGWHDLFFANTASNLYMAGGNLWNAVLQTASLGNTLDANTQLITNIGHANTDFTSGGGLNIAGNVGIGTTGPQYKLDIVGNSALWQSVYGTDDGLVGYWPFSEGTGTKAYDRSPYGNDGTLTSGPTSSTGKYGNALDFDGTDDYVNTVNKVLFTTEFTMEAWFYKDIWKDTGVPDANAGKEELILSKWNRVSVPPDTDYGYFFGRFYGGTNFGIHINNGADGTSSKEAFVATSTISTGSWHHVVATFKGSTYLRLYIDGVLVNENTASMYASVGDATAYTLQIGRLTHGYGQFDGKLRDVKIYNRAISTDEVKAHYLRGRESGRAVAMETSTSAGNLYGLRSVVTDTGVVTAGTDTAYGSRIDVTRTGATGGTINSYGQYIALTADNAGAGTSNSYGLYVDTSGSTADNNYGAYFSGSVGIGTTNPGYKLEVSGGNLGIGANKIIGTNAVAGNVLLKAGNGMGSSPQWHMRNEADNAYGDLVVGVVFPEEAAFLTAKAAQSNRYQIVRNNDATNQFQFNVPTGAGFEFSINDAGKVVIDSSGNVGIGTTAPQIKLEVHGVDGMPTADPATTNADLRIGNGAGGTIIDFGSQSSTGRGYIQARHRTGVGAYYDLVLNPNGGSVGIGTTVPGTKLQITGAGGSDSTNGLSITGLGSGATKAIDLSNTGLANDGNHYLFYRGSNDYLSMDGVLKISNEFGINLRGSETDPGIFFANENTGFFSPAANQLAVTINSAEKVRIDSTGNVGIGTTVPSYPLDILGTGGIIARFQAPGSTPDLQVASTGGMTVGLGMNTGVGGYTGTTSNSNFELRTNNAARLTILSGGNVGIGTTTVNSKTGILGNLAVGATYGSLAAPTSGAIIEGKVGIGTTAPMSTLDIVGNVTFTPVAFDKVYNQNGGAWTDNTAEAKTSGGTAFAILGGSTQRFYVGMDRPFDAVYFDIATPLSGTTLTLNAEYSPSFFELTVNDGTSVFTQDGTITFTPPSDWVPTSVNGVTKYWVKLWINYAALSVSPTAYYVSPNGGSQFSVYSNAGDVVPILYNDYKGRIGIGMTSPTEKLTIAGNIAPASNISYSLGMRTVSATAGVTMSGGANYDYLGRSVATGDVNNDGYDDVIAGAYGYSLDYGAVYIDTNRDGTADVTIYGEGLNSNEYFGYSVASGDVNNDGYDDVIAGAYGFTSGASASKGKVYVYYGAASMDTTADKTILGASSYAYFGYSVASGDVNNDGYDDVIVGAYGAVNDLGYTRGRAYVYYGAASMDTTADVTMTGLATNDELGNSVASGDVNNDGYADLIAGAPYANAGGIDRGQVYIDTNRDGTADVTISGTADNELLGWSSLASGDVNNDGYADVVVRSGTGAYLYYGGASMDATADKTFAAGGNPASAGDVNVDGYEDVIIGSSLYYGEADMDTIADVTLSGSVAAAGDVNGDGLADVVMGNYNAAGGGTSRGEAYVHYGMVTRWQNVVSQNINAKKIGVGLTGAPARAVHINDAMRLEPRATAPSSPASGDIYVDSTPASDELCFYDGAAWQGISSGTDGNCA